MYLERTTIRRIEQVLLFGSVVTLLTGLGLLFFPAVVAEAIRIDVRSPAFVQFAGLLLALLGAAYSMTLLDREKNRAILTLGFFQKLGTAVLVLTGALLGNLPTQMLAVSVFDGLLAIFFLLHVQGARSDGWL